YSSGSAQQGASRHRAHATAEGICPDMAQPDWWGETKAHLRELGVLFGGVGAGAAAAAYVHDTARFWEVPALVVALGLSVACPIWYLRTKRHGWLVSLLTTLLVTFSCLAISLHGWFAAVRALVLIAQVGLGVAGAVVISLLLWHRRRVRRDLESLAREVGQDLFGEGP